MPVPLPVNNLMGTATDHNTAIWWLAIDGWAVAFDTASRWHGGCSSTQSPLHCTKCNSTPTNGQCM